MVGRRLGRGAKEATMKLNWLWGVMALLMISSSGAGLAQEVQPKKATPVPVLYRLTCWEVDDAVYQALRGKAKVDLKAVQGRRVQEAELLSISGTDSLVHVGQKEPLVYYDSRASQFQIHFVDTGFKLDVNWDGDVLEVRPEVSDVQTMVVSDESGRIARYPKTHVQISEAYFSGVGLGETYLLSGAGGRAAVAQVRVLDPKPKAKNLILTLTLEAP